MSRILITKVVDNEIKIERGLNLSTGVVGGVIKTGTDYEILMSIVSGKKINTNAQGYISVALLIYYGHVLIGPTTDNKRNRIVDHQIHLA